VKSPTLQRIDMVFGGRKRRNRYLMSNKVVAVVSAVCIFASSDSAGSASALAHRRSKFAAATKVFGGNDFLRPMSCPILITYPSFE